jgi:hypothetical protein
VDGNRKYHHTNQTPEFPSAFMDGAQLVNLPRIEWELILPRHHVSA